MYKRQVRKCTNSGDLKAYSPDDIYNTEKGTGGIVGVNAGEGENKARIEDCINTGYVYGYFLSGGITGWNQSAVVINCINHGDVRGSWNCGDRKSVV